MKYIKKKYAKCAMLSVDCLNYTALLQVMSDILKA